jgi:hypothetical protein
MENYTRRKNNMSNVNDQRILELKKQIEVKKKELGKTLRFTPITNCSIEIDGIRYNIQVLQKRELTELMIKLNCYLLSAKDLGVECVFTGYNVQDWITDIKSKLEIISRKIEEQSLKLMEDKLSKLLSEGKKVELEINEIESILNIGK